MSILATIRRIIRPVPNPRRNPTINYLDHLRDVPPYMQRHRDEIADLDHDAHIAKLVQMRREMRETKQ